MNIKKLPYRNHFSKKKFKLYYYENINEKNISIKPGGLWYGINDSVIKWFELDPNDEEQIKYVNKKYIYEINLKKNSFSTNLNIKGKNKILQIKNFDQMNIFHEKYKEKKYGYIGIDWDKVSKDYGGIEFTNYDKILKKIIYDLNFYKYKKYTWFTTLDFNSGCIWNLNILKDFKYKGEIKDFYPDK